MESGTKPLEVHYSASTMVHGTEIIDYVTVMSKVKYYEPEFRAHRYDSKSTSVQSYAVLKVSSRRHVSRM